MTAVIPHESITSAANPRVRTAAALRAAEARRETGMTLVDGRRELARAATAGVPIVELFVAADLLSGQAERSAADAALVPWLAERAACGTRITSLAPRPFERIAFGSRNEGIVGVVRFSARGLTDVTFAGDRPLFVIEGVEKPGNLGAILRTADAVGLAGVLVCAGRTDPTNPAVIRASLGTAFTVPVAAADVAGTLSWLRGSGRRVVAATPTGTRPWHEARLAGSTAILLGSEAHGISPAWSEAARSGAIALETIRLPMRGIADSLNLSVTAGVLAYESLRQQGFDP